MILFLTGAGGYIGGTVAAHLIAEGYTVRGLVRDPDKAPQLRARGIIPVIGDLDDAALLTQEAQGADGVVNTANADHMPSVQVFVDALAGSGKVFLHTSGSSVVGDDARGLYTSDRIFDEDTPFVVAPGKQARHALNATVLGAASAQVRSVVICPTLVYGTGSGLNLHSIQIPFLASQARKHGAVRVVGQGLNRWSTVHIDDLAQLFVLAVRSAPAGSFYFGENGEASFAEIGAAIAQRLGMAGVQSIDADAAAAAWGEARAFYTFGSNSRVRARRARRELGWHPRYASVLDWIQHEMNS